MESVPLKSTLVRLLKARWQNLVREEHLEFNDVECPERVTQWSALLAGAGTVSSGAGSCCFQAVTCLSFAWEKSQESEWMGRKKIVVLT